MAAVAPDLPGLNGGVMIESWEDLVQSDNWRNEQRKRSLQSPEHQKLSRVAWGPLGSVLCVYLT